MIKVSFILPCYNVAAYIGRCLDSIENQDIMQDEYEVICVDDCSTDNTIEIISFYQKQYSNIRLFCHTENQTAGGARNTGIQAAVGDYLWFVDPDDEIERCIVGSFYGLAATNSLDVLLFGHTTYDEKGALSQTFKMKESSHITDGQSFIEQVFPGRIADVCMMVNVLYHRQYLMENGIRFPRIKASQDVVFAWDALLHASKVQSVDNNGYIVYKRPESTTGIVGRNKADKMFSRTVLFPFEVIMIRDGLQSTIIRNDLERVIKWCVNDSLYSLSKAERIERKVFLSYVRLRPDEIHGLEVYMSRATKWLLTNSSPFFLWNIELMIIQLLKSVRSK